MQNTSNESSDSCRPLAKQVIGQYQGDHGLGHGNDARRDGWVVPAFDLDLAASPATRSTVCCFLEMEGVGLTAILHRMGPPVEMPPRIPPA